jgi:hypothetical protein
MVDEIEAAFHPAFWIVLIVLAIGVVLYGFGSGMADHIWGPDPEEIRAECVAAAKVEKDRCLNGGVGAVFKTSKRIKTCDDIYEKEYARCGGTP